MKNAITYVALTLLVITPAMVTGISQAQASISCYTFNTNHKVGSTLASAEATALKNDLITEGLWSTGVALTSYNSTVAKAITTFQEKYSSTILEPNGLTSGNGYFGDYTRAKMNSLYGCAATASVSTPNISPSSTPAPGSTPSACPSGYTCKPIVQTNVPVCPSGWTCTPIASGGSSPTPAPTPDNSDLLSQQINQLTSGGNSAYSDYYASNSNVVTIPATASTTTTYGLGKLGCADQGNCDTGASTTVIHVATPAVPLTTHTRGSGGGWDGTATSPYLAYTGCTARGDCAVLVANALYPTPNTLASGNGGYCPKGTAVAKLYNGSYPTPSGGEPMWLCLHGGDPIPPSYELLDPYCPGSGSANVPTSDCIIGEAGRNNPYINPWIDGQNILGVKEYGSANTLLESNLCQNPVSLQMAATTLKSLYANDPQRLSQLMGNSTLYVHGISLANFEEAAGNFSFSSNVNVRDQNAVIAEQDANTAQACTNTPCYEAGDGAFSKWVNANDWFNSTFQSLLASKNIQIDGNSIVPGFTHLNGGGFAYLGRCLDAGYKSNFPAFSQFFTQAVQRAKTAGLAQ